MLIFTVDTFTEQPFAGNPAGVCILDKILSDNMMLKIAREINFSETAFVQISGINQPLNLRWFTPTQEADLCGHATLATAKVLYDTHVIDTNKTIAFTTRSGLLTARLVGSKIELNFPSIPIIPASSDAIIDELVNDVPKFVGVNNQWCLIELENETAVRNIIPDFELLKTHNLSLFIITAKSSHPKYDFVSRFFGPAVGINEDPVTGSAHCCLTPYWKEKLKKDILVGLQVSDRLGEIECELIANDRVLLRGSAIIMSEIKQNWI